MRTTAGVAMNSTKSVWLGALGRLLLLAGIGTLGLALVLPLFQSGNEPRPTLQASDDLFGVVVDGIGQEANPYMWATVHVTDPDSDTGSELRIVLQFRGSVSPSSLSGAFFLQGELADSFVACDGGQADDAEFNALSEVEKQLAFKLMQASSEDATADELALAERAATLSFKRVTFTEEFEGASADTSRTLWIKCRLDSNPLWNNPAGSTWDVDMSAVGLSVPASQDPKTSESAGSVNIQASLDVSRGDQLFYQEGYPAPSARDQEKDTYRQSSSGYSIISGRVEAITGATTARYSDSVDESQRNSLVFLAGVLAGLFVSFIGAGVVGLIDTWLKFDPSPRAPEPLNPPEPAKRRSLSSLIRRTK